MKIESDNIEFCIEICKSIGGFVFPYSVINSVKELLNDESNDFEKLYKSAEYSYLLLGIEPQGEISEEHLRIIKHQAFPWVLQYLRERLLTFVMIKQIRENWDFEEFDNYVFDLQVVEESMLGIETLKRSETMLLEKLATCDDRCLRYVFAIWMLLFDRIQDVEAVKNVYQNCKGRL